jgi:hypothetical protein
LGVGRESGTGARDADKEGGDAKTRITCEKKKHVSMKLTKVVSLILELSGSLQTLQLKDSQFVCSRASFSLALLQQINNGSVTESECMYTWPTSFGLVLIGLPVSPSSSCELKVSASSPSKFCGLVGRPNA